MSLFNVLKPTLRKVPSSYIMFEKRLLALPSVSAKLNILHPNNAVG